LTWGIVPLARRRVSACEGANMGGIYGVVGGVEVGVDVDTDALHEMGARLAHCGGAASEAIVGARVALGERLHAPGTRFASLGVRVVADAHLYNADELHRRRALVEQGHPCETPRPDEVTRRGWCGERSWRGSTTRSSRSRFSPGASPYG